jgi:hypothetical protein
MAKRDSLKKKPQPIPVKVIVEEKTKWKKFLIKAGKIIGGISLAIGLLVGVTKLWDWVYPKKEKVIIEKTARQKFNEDYIDSSLNPPLLYSNSDSNFYSFLEYPPIFSTPINDNNPFIKGIKIKDTGELSLFSIIIGSKVIIMPVGNLYAGIKMAIPSNAKCYHSFISFGIKNDRMYVSVEFKDILKEETIGYIEYNHWRLYKPNLFDFKNTDEKLEVIDRQHNIVFSIKYTSDPTLKNVVVVSGYFINQYSIVILSNKAIQDYNGIPRPGFDTCIDKSGNWKQKASVLISDIKTIFPIK